MMKRFCTTTAAHATRGVDNRQESNIVHRGWFPVLGPFKGPGGDRRAETCIHSIVSSLSKPSDPPIK